MADRLRDKVALITGGGTGIGQSIAAIFAREGAKVVVAGRTVETLEKTVQIITGADGDAIYVRGDVSKAVDVENMVRESVAKYGKLNVLVNNAGVRGSIHTILDLTEEEWNSTFDVDAKGSWLCSKYAIPELRKAGGGSISYGFFDFCAYRPGKTGCLQRSQGSSGVIDEVHGAGFCW